MKPIPITLRQIDYVIAAAESGSTAAAARALNVSQPSVSLAIAKVEAHFGRDLFARSGGQGIVLTAFGHRKLEPLRRLREQAQATLGQDEMAGKPIHFGVFSTLGPRYAPGLVRLYREAEPQAGVRLVEGDLEQLAHWLETGRIDLALIYDFGLPSQLDIIPLADVRPYGLIPAGHRLAGKGSAPLADLLSDPLILMNLPHSREFFLTLAQLNGARPRIAHETGTIEMLRAMVANNLGVGLLATDIAQDTSCDGRKLLQIDLDGTLVPHRIALARASRAQVDEGVLQFQAFIQWAFERERLDCQEPPL